MDWQGHWESLGSLLGVGLLPMMPKAKDTSIAKRIKNTGSKKYF